MAKHAVFIACLGVCYLFVVTEGKNDVANDYVRRRVKRSDDFPASEIEVANLAQKNSETQVGFYAWNGASRFSVPAYATIIFDHTYTNIGNAFDTHSGTFTAPISGAYAFYLTIRSYTDSGFVVDITLEGSSRSRAYVLHSNLQATCHLVIHLNKGQRVWVKSITGSSHDVYGSTYSHFSGFLVQPD